ncbi:P-II family nitrogen regulator [Treponema pectinovorum]|uniref:P-II family nitrogen regulator n=1 Tax=Treponema pectinovorum TaxID=164 RepID=UPI0011C87FE9|nr:P-II family nitrogen regulator [Treponema pectinovorum]
MSPYKLFFSVVPHGKGEKLTRAAVESGCGGGTVVFGRSLAKSNFQAILGLGETSVDLILMLVESDVANPVRDAIINSCLHEKKNFGIFFATDVNFLLKAGNATSFEDKVFLEEKTMHSENELITVIVNKGYAEDIMVAARRAGAGGGTVVNAHGTARENDERFFGMHIVPEKEMLLMIVPSEKKDAVMQAIKEVNCLKNPGMGIAYSATVEDFSLLGKN